MLLKIILLSGKNGYYIHRLLRYTYQNIYNSLIIIIISSKINRIGISFTTNAKIKYIYANPNVKISGVPQT